MYVLFDKDGRTHYVGDDREEAIRVLESNSGLSMEKAITVEDFANLLRRASFAPQSDGVRTDRIPYGEERVEEWGSDSDEDVDEILAEVLEAITKRFGDVSEAVWSNLAPYGVTKEKVWEVWEQVRQEAAQAAAEAELTGKQGLAKLGDVLVQLGTSLLDQAKK